MNESLKVVFTDDARLHVAGIKAWWAANRKTAPDLFAHELERALGELAEAPTLGSTSEDPRLRDVRRLLLPRTRYHVYYRVAGDTMAVLAVWHAQRGSGPRL